MGTHRYPEGFRREAVELETTRLGSRVVVTRPTLTRLLGMEPPLPGELDRARQAIADSSATTRLG